MVSRAGWLEAAMFVTALANLRRRHLHGLD